MTDNPSTAPDEQWERIQASALTLAHTGSVIQVWDGDSLVQGVLEVIQLRQAFEDTAEGRRIKAARKITVGLHVFGEPFQVSVWPNQPIKVRTAQ